MIMRIRTWMIPVAILLILSGSIAAAKAAGYWQTEGHGIETEYAGSADSAEIITEAITGKTTIDEVLSGGADAASLEALIGPWTDAQSTVRETAQTNGYTFSEVKDAVGRLMD